MCDCADKVDGGLAAGNTRLTRALVFSDKGEHGPNLLLQTEQIEKGRGKQKAVSMFLNFCPFCGEKYASR